VKANAVNKWILFHNSMSITGTRHVIFILVYLHCFVPAEEQSEESISRVVGCNKPRFFISAAAINFYRSESATFEPPYLILLPAKAIQRNFYYSSQIRSLLVLCARFAVARKAAAALVQVALAQLLSYLIAALQKYSLRVSANPKRLPGMRALHFLSVNIERRPRRLAYHTTRGKTNKTDARRECSRRPLQIFEIHAQS
jgi:hypothetical protein